MNIQNGKIYTLMLTITESCNLNCIYCYESFKSPKIMSIDVAKESISNTFALLNETNTLVISFHGGEPLKVFGLIKEICNWVWEHQWNCKYKIFASTNATLLTNDMKQWFFEHKDRIILGLSYDGTDAMQDINRSNSSKLIDKKFFSKTWLNQSVKMTISKHTVDNIAEGVISLHEQGFRVNANLAYGTDWNMEDSLKVFAEQLKKLADYYINNPEILPSSLLNAELGAIFPDNKKTNRQCGSGRNMCCVSQDGKIYPCHMFMPSSLLSERDIIKIQKKLESENEHLLSEKCSNCYMEAICPTCYGMNLIVSGDLSERRYDYCKMMKIKTLAVTYMFGQMLSSYQSKKYVAFRDFDENKINTYKRAISYLQEKLQHEDFILELISESED